MRRFFASLATFSLVEAIGRHPAIAGALMLLGVGGGAAGIAIITTPTITPFVSANFNPNQTGNTNNGLKPNGGTAGALTMPIGNSVTGYTGSFGIYGEATINPNLAYSGATALFAGLNLFPNAQPGLPAFVYQRNVNGSFPNSNWWQYTNLFPLNGGTPTGGAGSNYTSGFYPFTATGGGCAREPSGVWFGTVFQNVDPGLGCAVAPTFSAATVAGSGAQQATGASSAPTTCAVVNGQAVVTAKVAVAHGLTPGMTYAMGGFTPTGYNALLTAPYTALLGTTGTTLVGTTGAGSCPAAVTVEGTALSGTGASYTFPAILGNNGLNGTGITTKNGQHICFMIGEYGDDSSFPGAQFLSMVDDKGNPLPGSPALVQTPNMGTANFTGFTAASSAVLTVTAMNPYTITSAAWSNAVSGFTGLGLVTFQVSSNPGYVAGSQFQVSGMSPSSVNGWYAAVNGTNSTQIIGNQLTGPGGIPQAYANPGAITTASTPQMISVIQPGMMVLGGTGNVFVMSYGTSATTGTGGVGTYALNSVQTAAIGSVGSPVTIFAWAPFYYSAAASGNPAGGVATVRAAFQPGDFTSVLGTSTTSIAPPHTGWGGALGNFAMLAGIIPNQTGGAPSTSDLASLCTKTTDIQAYAAAHSLKVESLYRLNDLGVFGDSGNATITGYITNPGGAAATLNVVSTPYGSLALATGTLTAKLTGVGLPVAAPVTIGLSTSAGSVYSITPNTTAALGSSGSPVTLAVGAFLPALPIQSNTMKGYIDTTSGVSTLHVTSLDDGTTHSGFASFTGTLGTSLIAHLDNGLTGGSLAPGNVLTVTSPGGAPPLNSVVGVGTQVCPAVGSSAFTCVTVTQLGTGDGLAGTYIVNDATQQVASQTMFGSGILPGPATTLQTTSVTGTLVAGMAVTDGGASLTGSPLLIISGAGAVWNVAGNYYPPIASEAMTASLTTLTPGEYIQNSTITNPVKVVSYGPGAIGLLGNYVLSGSPNASGSVGSAGSPVVFFGTTITDSGAIAPGPALTIRDQGPAVTFPLTNISAKTGTLALSGDYDVPTLGGTPSGIQVLVSNSANGPPLAGCTPCNWGALTGTITGGKWAGTLAGVPGGGPYIVSVRAANGVGYATLPSSVKVGWVFALWGQGQAGSIATAQSGTFISYFSGLWGTGGWSSGYGNNELYLTGGPVAGNWVPAQAGLAAGDRFGVTAVSEAFGAFDQELSNSFGVPATFLQAARDGVGIGSNALGNVAQTQTVDVGDGSTLSFCSAATFCPSAGVSPAGQLVFGAASLTGGWFTGTVGVNGSSQPIVTIGSSGRIGGALEPGMVLSTPNAPKLLMCLTGCSSQMAFNSSTWLLSNNLDNGASGAMRADPPASLLPSGTTTTPWPNFNIQLQGGTGAAYGLGGFGAFLVKAGTFKITDTDPATGIATTVCQDSQVFAYNNTGGNCTGANVASSGTFVNYQTGDYQVTFTSGHAPLSGHAITASWTNIVSPEAGAGATLSRPQGIDFFGDGTAQSGPDSAIFAKAPGGVNGHIFSGMGTDKSYMFNAQGPTNVGYQFGGVGYSQMLSWLYGAKFPNTVPGASPGVSFITTGQWRVEGPLAWLAAIDFEDGIYEQWAQDAVTQSLFTGHVSAAASASVGTLTLDASTTYPMWEGEILGCVALSSNCSIGPYSGAYITSIASGAWGASGSVYNIALSPVAAGVSTSASQPMQNPVFYSGSGPAFYAGTLNDIIVQSSGTATTIGRQGHTSNGFAGGRRATSRWAAMIYCHNGGGCDDPKLSRANDTAAGTPSPAFDYGSTYQAGASATWSGNTVTITGGLAAHARPFVVGQTLLCSSCASGLVITSLSVPPTQSTATGAGEVGQTFTFTAKNAAGAVIGGSGSGLVAASCTSGSGGSNCINVDIALNVSGATAIDTCGANNLNGNAPNYAVPFGKCQGNGIGEIVRTFRIGTVQAMYGSAGAPPSTPGSVFDDGVDLSSFGGFNQNSAFTCNIVAAKVVQCVKGPAYTAGVLSGVGKWASGSTYVSYGDLVMVSGRVGSLLGYVGGQSFPFTPGSGYTNGTTTVTATCTLQATGFNPKFDVTVAGGAIVNVYPSTSAGGSPVGFGLLSTCTVPLPSGGSGGAIATVQLAPVEGQGGVATYNTDSNTMGMFLYDNSGETNGTLLNGFFTNGQSGYFEPGLPVRPFGQFQGAAVSG